MKKGTKFHHLTKNDRLVISRMILKGYEKEVIAHAIGCSLRTVYYEIKRARYSHTDSELVEHDRYNPDEADRLYRERLKLKGKTPKILSDKRLLEYIRYMVVEMKYSPEAIIFEIHTNPALSFDVEIKSVNTIYTAIARGYIEGVSLDVLPRMGRRKRKKRKTQIQKVAAPGTSIEKRPESILAREEFGHWEMDSLMGKQGSKKAALVLTERKTRTVIVEKLKSHTSYEVVKALNRLEKVYKCNFYNVFKTITVDNGCEFKDFEGMEKALYRQGQRTKIYYCHPRAPQERGSNEHSNSLLRRMLPKSGDFDIILTRSAAKEAEWWLNTYPRRLFSGSCSLDLFNQEMINIGAISPYG